MTYVHTMRNSYVKVGSMLHIIQYGQSAGHVSVLTCVTVGP